MRIGITEGLVVELLEQLLEGGRVTAGKLQHQTEKSVMYDVSSCIPNVWNKIPYEFNP
jgi:hypothetical protein